MGAGHDHGHTHGGPPPTGTAAAAYRGRLRVALGITLGVMVMEIVGGVLADSLALIADAAHMATDALGLGMALLAIHFANKAAGPNRTFGYARAEILAALANCLLLLGVGGYLVFEAVDRFITPAETLGSVTVLVSAGIIMATGWQAADPIASLLIGLMIVPRTVKLLRETLDVLLESAPKGVDMGEVRAHITALPGVLDVHDLHAWTITSGMPVLSAHVVVHQELLDSVGHEKLLHELQGCLGVHFDVEHCTFQLEPSGHAEHEARLCH